MGDASTGTVHRGGDGRLEAAVLAADTRNSCLSLPRITAPLCESDEAAGLASATVRALAPSKEALDAPLSLRVSPTSRSLLPGSRANTRAGLRPAGLVQFPGRNIARPYREHPTASQTQNEAHAR
jgi:hypothetical protein